MVEYVHTGTLCKSTPLCSLFVSAAENANQFGFQINYFKLLATLGARGEPMNPEANRKAMAVS